MKTNIDMVIQVVVVAVLTAMAAGWVMNIIKLVSATSIGGTEVARAIGIFFAPLGSVLGLFI